MLLPPRWKPLVLAYGTKNGFNVMYLLLSKRIWGFFPDAAVGNQALVCPIHFFSLSNLDFLWLESGRLLARKKVNIWVRPKMPGELLGLGPLSPHPALQLLPLWCVLLQCATLYSCRIPHFSACFRDTTSESHLFKYWTTKFWLKMYYWNKSDDD